VAGKPDALATEAEVAVDDVVVEETCEVQPDFVILLDFSLPDLLTVLLVTVDRNAAAYVF
jgi:hypothetical protein